MADEREYLKAKFKEAHEEMMEFLKKGKTGLRFSGAEIYEALKVYEVLLLRNSEIHRRCSEMLQTLEST